MAQILRFLLIIVFYSFTSCTGKSTDKKVGLNAANLISKCDLDRAQNEILKLPEVTLKNKMIDSLSNHTHGISLLSDSTTIDGIKYYEIKAGYNSDIRYETYYNFYVEKGNCQNIKVAEPIEGDIIPISEWRIRNQNRNEKPVNLENWPYKSFVISCGSGCAMTYSAVKIAKNTQNIIVKFKVEKYLDEVLTETFEEDCIFSYDSSSRLQLITRKGDNEDFLKTQSSSSQESFKKFGSDVMKFVLKEPLKPEEKNIVESKISFPLVGNTIEILDYPTSEKFNFITIEGESPSSVIEINENLLLSWFDGDRESWYLLTIENKKVLDNLLVGKSETVETEKGTFDNYIDFIIDKNLMIALTYSSGKSVDSRKIQKTEKYKIRSDYFVRF